MVAGEQVLVDWYLYVQTSGRFEVLVEPGMDGFWSEDLLGDLTRVNDSAARTRCAMGACAVALLSARALFPLQTGTLTISPWRPRSARWTSSGGSCATSG